MSFINGEEGLCPPGNFGNLNSGVVAAGLAVDPVAGFRAVLGAHM